MREATAPRGPAWAPRRSPLSLWRRCPPRWQSVLGLAAGELVAWGTLYYAFAVLLVPMKGDLDASAAELTAGFSIGLLVSALAGVAVGRYLDRHSPRLVMTAGAAAGVLILAAWSRIDGLTALYVVWIALGVAMSCALYEPAFTVLAKRFVDGGERRRAMTTLTLIGALASLLFMPLSQALVDAIGWRRTLLVLAALLAVTTVPLYARFGQAPPRGPPDAGTPHRRVGVVARQASLWALAGAFFLASAASIAVMIHAIPLLVDRGYSASMAALAVGLMGAAQIPGRLVFAVVAGRLPPRASLAAVFAPIAVGATVVASDAGTVLTVSGLLAIGAGNGMATLARAIVVAEDYGTALYGTVAGVVAGAATSARAAGPLLAALFAQVAGYAAMAWAVSAVAAAACALACLARTRAARGQRSTMYAT